jgi:MFS transporter, AAHS family, 4-hydroxybenzoate transporter
MSDRAPIDVAEIIDGAPFRGLPLWIAAFSFAFMIADGFDIQSMAFVAPALAAEWGVRREWLGPVLAASIVGMAAGSVALGWLGDRIGRKAAFCVSVGLLAVGSFASSMAGELTGLVLYRFITGLGLGGAVPLAASFVAEWTLRRWRGTVVTIVVVAIPLGGLLGAALAQHIIPAYGWRAVFVVGGVFPLLFLVIALVMLPESPKFLTGRPDRWGELARSLNRLPLRSERFTGRERFVMAERDLAGCSGLMGLLRAPYLATTLLLWAAFSLNTLALYGFVNWLPTILSSSGASLSFALNGSILFNFGGLFGSLGGSLLIALCGSQRVGAAVASAGALAALVIGIEQSALGRPGVNQASLLLLPLVTVAGACLNGMQAFLYAVAAHSYPTNVRATGVGSAAAVARIGGVLSSVVGSAFFALGLSLAVFFYVLAAVIVVTAISFFCLRSHIPATWRRAASAAPVAGSWR